jgi:glutaminyl-tRNA synthetase
LDFIRTIIEDDLRSGKHQRVVSRFPPEPNGYLHIGHSKAICLNFGVAAEYGGVCHLRFDDTNPTKEDIEYVESIQNDVRWLGFDWHDKLFYASDYFEALYDYAIQLIEAGKAYVCSLNDEEIRKYRGTISEPGTPSPDRDRSVAENLDLFKRMRNGEFPDGAYVLRAKIDMSAANMKMRDPPLYRIRHQHHYRQGDKWCIYPLYDFTHGLSDSIERITHSLCTLEFENNRELYDWFLDELPVPKPSPRQIEFARLNLTYTVMSKRKLLELVRDKHVSGWDDPRMPTIAGLRRRGYTPESIRNFCDRIGVAKNNSVVELSLLEHSVREDLNQKAPRVLAVLDPLKVIIDNYPEGQTEEIDAPYFPADIPKEGSRKVPFSREILIERSDFAENPPPGFFRLAPGLEVRLRYAYVIRCTRVVKDAAGNVTAVHASYDPKSKGGATGNRQVKGTIHWLSTAHAGTAEVRLYDRLFSDSEPDRGKDGPDFKSFINPHSLEIVTARIEPALSTATHGDRYQFERQGFFAVDPDSKPGKLVFNRIVALRDSWAKEVKKSKGESTPANQSRRSAAQEKAKTAQAQKPVVKKPLGEAALALVESYRLSPDDARLIADSSSLSSFFAETLAHHDNPPLVAKWITNELLRELKGRDVTELTFGPKQFAELLGLLEGGTISGKIAKDVFAELLAKGGSPKAIVERTGGLQITSESDLLPFVEQVLSSQSELVARYKAGNEGVLAALVGQLMKATSGRANPQLANALLRKKLSN